jgi:hypothetical protein
LGYFFIWKSLKRTEFYKQGLDILLGKWDEARGVERDDVYRGFLLPQKLKFLSQIAAVTFKKGQYFFASHNLQAIGIMIWRCIKIRTNSPESICSYLAPESY